MNPKFITGQPSLPTQSRPILNQLFKEDTHEKIVLFKPTVYACNYLFICILRIWGRRSWSRQRTPQSSFRRAEVLSEQPRYSNYQDPRSHQGLAGGVVGSVLGYEIGNGDPIATGLGAAAGSYLGNGVAGRR